MKSILKIQNTEGTHENGIESHGGRTRGEPR